ncbi:MAG: error-prone DNA polymerase [Myxococcales bacterium]|nr:error-prone DNA polymerase [Myxococcales bacterium]
MRSPRPEYAELHCHSAHSMLDGASIPEALLDRAVALGLRALALTDHDDLGGVVRFATHARLELGDFPAIPGLELTVEGDPPSHLTLLARDAEGYAQLGRLVTLARHREPRGQPRVPFDALATHAAGLLCLSGCPRGEVPARLQADDHLGARRAAGRLRDVFGRHFAIEVMDHGLPESARLAGALIHLAGELDVPWVVTNNVHYATPDERVLHDVLTCLRTHTTLDTAGRRLRPNAEWHLKGPAALAARWRHDLAGLRASVALAERCTFRLGELEPALPETPLPPGFDDPDEFLAHLTREGARRRWGPALGPRHEAQLTRELDLVRRKGLAGYFLIMWEIIEFARGRGILVQGRGSAANSAVCYCLGITAVDPIRFNLLFERFLSEARDGYPDIDLDIAHARREEVLQFVYARYGRTYAAMVCEHICFRGRSAVRDAARVLGFSVDEGGRLAEQVGRAPELTRAMVEAAGFDPDAPRLRSLLRVVAGLRGLPRHRSIHVGGFVLSSRPIAEVVGVEPASMEGRTIIQWDKDDLEAAKLPKFDLLGLGMLTALAESLELVSARRGAPLGLYALPQDPAVYDMICRADTVGVFQIESRAQMNCLPRTRPRTFYDLAVQVALIRPGPLQGDMVHPYIRRRRGEEPVELIHPSLEPILGRTLGVPLFQEQGMQLAIQAAGFTAVEADALRRAMGSQRHRHRLSELTDRLLAGMHARGIDPDYAQRVVKQIEAFSTYGFPESHSTSFALLVYASCWVKHHHPDIFLCALLNAQPLGFYSAATLIKDAQRHGVRVLPPCLAESTWPTRLAPEGVRLGLRLVDGLGAQAKAKLEAARATGPFGSAAEVVQRTGLPQRALVTLAEAGAFDALVPGGRRDAVWQVLHLARAAAGPLPLGPPDDPAVHFPAQTPLERTRADYETMGLTTGRHPVAYVRPLLRARGAVAARDLPRWRDGAWVRVAGLVNTRQRPEAAKGFFFVTLEDETGFVNVIVRPPDFERNRRVLVQAPFLWIEGPVSAEQGVWNVKGRSFRAMDLAGMATAPPSHDFR